MSYAVCIAGGGPAGLSAALTLGRSRKRVLLVDGGQARNAAAEQVYGFVTRDGTPPAEFRRVAREQLARYPSVSILDTRVKGVDGTLGRFVVTLDNGASIDAERVLLCLGLEDEPPDLPGCSELWGRAVLECPYCHGWEVQDRTFGYMARTAQALELPLLLKSWTQQVVAFTDGRFEVPVPSRRRLAERQVAVEERPISRVLTAPSGDQLAGVELRDGTVVECQVLFVEPRQRQTPLVQGLGLELDERGSVRVNEDMETSRPGISAAGDLASHHHGALVAAAEGSRAAHAINRTLTLESR
jgi:thioredoxin reductase